MNMKLIIQVRNLEKYYKDRKALNSISFDVGEREILCLLGPNGAGKSTLIDIFSTVLNYDGGEIYFRGEKVENVKKDYKGILGIVPQDIAIYEDISAEDNVRFFASLYGTRGRVLNSHVEMALNSVGLLERKRDKPKTFSGGMKRRLNIACAIAHRPSIIIMDEPTVGVDPQSRNHILGNIKSMGEAGTTIIYSTHYMEEVEEISTRIIIMDHGRIIAEGTKEELKEILGEDKVYYIEVDDIENLQKDELYMVEGVTYVEIVEYKIRVSVLRGIESLDKLISTIMHRGLKINNISNTTVNLDTVFLKLTGRNLRN